YTATHRYGLGDIRLVVENGKRPRQTFLLRDAQRPAGANDAGVKPKFRSVVGGRGDSPCTAGEGDFEFPVSSIPGVAVGDRITYWVEVDTCHPGAAIPRVSKKQMVVVRTKEEFLRWASEVKVRSVTDVRSKQTRVFPEPRAGSQGP